MLVNFPQAAKNVTATGRDDVVRSTIQSVFNYMGIGLIITTIVSFLTANSPALLNLIFGSPLKWLVLLAPFGFIIYMNAKFKSATKAQLQTAFWLFCGVMGLSLSSIFLAYSGVSIFRAFATASCMFLSMSIYGYSTKKDLTSMGSFMFMGLVGIIIAMVINFFLKSTALDLVVSMIGIIVFMGLTAWDVQKVKRTAVYASMDSEQAGKLGIMHALSLYLDFINIFLFLLRLQNR